MQKDFIDGALGTKEAVEIVPKVQKKIEHYQNENIPVVFTLDTHEENYLQTQEGKKLPVIHCIKNSSGWKLDSHLLQYSGNRFEKNTFGSLKLASWIKENDFKQIELIGLCTDICVISNALILKATVPEAIIQVDSSCCAGVTPASHQTALDAMRMCQIEIL